MKKFIAVLFLMAICLPIKAEDRHSINSVSNGTFSTTYSTPSTAACELSYILITTTGAGTTPTFTIRDNATSKFVITVASTETKIQIDLGDCPVRFGTNLNVVSDKVDASVDYVLVYKKLN